MRYNPKKWFFIFLFYLLGVIGMMSFFVFQYGLIIITFSPVLGVGLFGMIDAYKDWRRNG